MNAYVGGDVIDRIFQAIMDIETMDYVFSLKPKDMLGGIIFAGLVKLIVYSKGRNAKKFRKGEEYESARWEIIKILLHIWMTSLGTICY